MKNCAVVGSKISMGKILSLLFVTLLFATLSSCSKDDDKEISPPAAKELILGKWYAESSTSGLNACQKKTNLTFKEMGMGELIDFRDNGASCVQQAAVNLEYEVIDNKHLLLKQAGVIQYAEILSVTPDQMVWRFELGDLSPIYIWDKTEG